MLEEQVDAGTMAVAQDKNNNLSNEPERIENSLAHRVQNAINSIEQSKNTINTLLKIITEAALDLTTLSENLATIQTELQNVDAVASMQQHATALIVQSHAIEDVIPTTMAPIATALRNPSQSEPEAMPASPAASESGITAMELTTHHIQDPEISSLRDSDSLGTEGTDPEEILSTSSNNSENSVALDRGRVENEADNLRDVFKALYKAPDSKEYRDTAILTSIHHYVNWAKEIGAPAVKAKILEIIYDVYKINNPHDATPAEEISTQLGVLERAIVAGLDNFDFLFVEAADQQTGLALTPAQYKYKNLIAQLDSNSCPADLTTKISTVLEIIFAETEAGILLLESKYKTQREKTINNIDPTLHNDEPNTITAVPQTTRLQSEEEIQSEETVPNIDPTLHNDERSTIIGMLQNIRDAYKDIMMWNVDKELESYDATELALYNDKKRTLCESINTFVAYDILHVKENIDKQEQVMRQLTAAACDILAEGENNRANFLQEFADEHHAILVTWIQQPGFTQLDSDTRKALLQDFKIKLKTTPEDWRHALYTALLNQAQLHIKNLLTKKSNLLSAIDANNDVPSGVVFYALQAQRRAQSLQPDIQDATNSNSPPDKESPPRP